ncbi:hypothetical protein, partial [Vacuolonema iberomarrocanum]|uniref:hypothetical protein n=1 Tax=Vacuolonema iberomarrocanum TaxID=3454632 RepID=UPI003F6DD472
SQGDNTVSIGGWGNVPPKPYKPTICLRILLALENEDPTLNKYRVLRAPSQKIIPGFCNAELTELHLNANSS